MIKRPAIICARGGSKGVPGKNLKIIAGKPLIAWTIEQAQATGLFDQVVVSSDCPDILEVAGQAGVDLLVERPDALATDTVSVHPAIAHALEQAETTISMRYDSFVFLQATSPLRAPKDIIGAVALWDRHHPGSVVSATVAHASPYFSLVEEAADGTVGLSKPTDPPIVRRQDAPACYALNGAIYVFDRNRYESDPRVLYPDTRVFEMPPERSLDIDTPWDWHLVSLVMDAK
ncbi:MAG: acylneuraminate cytidylyltransferase family protein [Pelagimonas sp.]|jgi:N-acylneuraminate cytidylyltransferase/CMP-N,N'-diacetyllegionaminic acid synthase|nr:acylneuraminate cytidylyltransferase family protein [Pelagimonas sp.]